MDHGYAFFAHAAGSGLQVKLCRHRNDEHKVVFAAALGHQRLVYAGRVLAHAAGHIHTGHGHALFVGVLVGRIGHLFTFQNAHGIGFCFFSHFISTSYFLGQTLSVLLYKAARPRLLRHYGGEGSLAIILPRSPLK